MKTLRIGPLARSLGVSPSALRYYEKVGLIPPPARISGRRAYPSRIRGRIRIILLGRAAGFSIAETRAFLSGYPADVAPSKRWQGLARQKLCEIDTQMRQLRRMKAILRSNFQCDCPSLDDCEKLMAAPQFAKTWSQLRS
jgi:MerR family redox-sensitive transcriptional activator SoxR